MRDLTLQRLFAAYCLELRLTCWHWSYLLLQAVWGAFVIWSFSFSGVQSAASLLFSMSIGVMPIASLITIMLAGVSASRPTRSRFHMLEAAYPIGIESVLGHWLAFTTAMSALLIVPIGMATARGPLDDLLRTLPIFLIENITIFALIAALIWLLQITIGLKRWMYPLFAVAWMGSALLPALLNPETFPFALLLAFTAHGWLDISYSELWGRLTVGLLPLYHDLFYVALLTLMLAVMAAKIQQQRFYRVSRRSLLIMALSFGMMLFAAGRYSLIVAETNAHVSQQQQFVSAQVDNEGLPSDMPSVIHAYDITIDLSDMTQPQFYARMEIVNRSAAPLTQIDLSLNHQLVITQSSVPYERTVDFVRLTLAEALESGASFTFDLSYSGALWYYDGTIRPGYPREVTSFIRAEGVNLPCAVAWYPVVGRIVVGRTHYFSKENTRSIADCVADEPARFRLHIKETEDLTFASNLPRLSANEFAAESTTWASLLGAPTLVVDQQGPVMLVTAQTTHEFVQPLVIATYTSALEQMRHVFPQIKGVIVAVVESYISPRQDRTAAPITDGWLYVEVRATDLSAFATSPYNKYLFVEQAMINSLFGRGEHVFEVNVPYTESIGYFMGAYTLANGSAETLLTLLTEGIPMGEGGRRFFTSRTMAERYPLAHTFYTVYAEQGEEALIALLQAISAKTQMLNALPSAEAEAWIQEVAHAD